MKIDSPVFSVALQHASNEQRAQHSQQQWLADFEREMSSQLESPNQHAQGVPDRGGRCHPSEGQTSQQHIASDAPQAMALKPLPNSSATLLAPLSQLDGLQSGHDGTVVELRMSALEGAETNRSRTANTNDASAMQPLRLLGAIDVHATPISESSPAHTRSSASPALFDELLKSEQLAAPSGSAAQFGDTAIPAAIFQLAANNSRVNVRDASISAAAISKVAADVQAQLEAVGIHPHRIYVNGKAFSTTGAPLQERQPNEVGSSAPKQTSNNSTTTIRED